MRFLTKDKSVPTLLRNAPKLTPSGNLNKPDPRKRANEDPDVNVCAEPQSQSESEPDEPNQPPKRKAFHNPDFSFEGKKPAKKQRTTFSRSQSTTSVGSSTGNNNKETFFSAAWGASSQGSSKTTRTYGSSQSSANGMRTLGQAHAEIRKTKSPAKDQYSRKNVDKQPSLATSSNPRKLFKAPCTSFDDGKKQPETPEPTRTTAKFINPTITPSASNPRRRIGKSSSFTLSSTQKSHAMSPSLASLKNSSPSPKKSRFKKPEIDGLDPPRFIPKKPFQKTSSDSSVVSIGNAQKEKCPICSAQLVSKAIAVFRRENEQSDGPVLKLSRLPFKLQTRLHHAHKRVSAEEEWKQRGYPEKLNWSAIPARVRKLDRELEQIIRSYKKDCPYRKEYFDRFIAPSSNSLPSSQANQASQSVPIRDNSPFEVDEDISLLPLDEDEIADLASHLQPPSQPLPPLQQSPEPNTVFPVRSLLAMNQEHADALMSRMTPGYYGSRGAQLLTECINRMNRVQNALDDASHYSPELEKGKKGRTGPKAGKERGSRSGYSTPPESSRPQPASRAKEDPILLNSSGDFSLPGREGKDAAALAQSGSGPGPEVRFGLQMQKLLTDHRIGGKVGFVQAVLVPAVAVRLVIEDMKLDGDKLDDVARARQIVEESVEIGDLLNPEQSETLEGLSRASVAKEVSISKELSEGESSSEKRPERSGGQMPHRRR